MGKNGLYPTNIRSYMSLSRQGSEKVCLELDIVTS